MTPISSSKYITERTARPASTANVSSKTNKTFQTKLTIGKSDDKYEREADSVGDQVVRQSTSNQAQAIQRKCETCGQEEKPHIQKTDEEEEIQAKTLPGIQREADEELQAKSEGNPGNIASGAVSSQISQSKGSGSPLPMPVRSQMESGIGADFSKVRVHTDSRAQNLSTQLNAQAFTVGNDVYFNKGRYNPESYSGKHLLAHELTHTVQQGESVQRMIQKQDSEADPLATDDEGFTFGRAPHPHKPGKWARVQYASHLNCNPSTSKVNARQRAIECICAVSTPAEVMKMVISTKMAFKPLAAMHLQYYLLGFGGELNEDENLRDMILSDDNIRQLVSYNIGKGFKSNQDSGHFMIEQSHYDDEGYQYTFGGIDRVDWEYFPETDDVRIWFKDPYDFHPIYDFYEEMGPGDVFPNGTVRESNCVHAAAVELLKTDDSESGAAIFIMKGDVTLPLSKFDTNASRPKQHGSDDIGSDVNGENLD